MLEPFAQRQRILRGKLKAQGLDCLLVNQPASIYYLTGFTGDAGVLLAGAHTSTLVTDGRFVVQAKQESPGLRVVQHRDPLYRVVGEYIQSSKSRKAGFDPSHLSVHQFGAAKRAAGRACHWIRATGLVEAQRARKDAAELARMRKAALLAGEVLESVLGLLRPGVRETEIAAEIEYRMRRGGASGMAFESIVAFGKRSALPHAGPTAKRLRKNELVVLDLGAILAHYCSDITRTVFVGRAPARIQGWYKAVLEAQAATIAAATAGKQCGDVDAAARQVLAAHRLDRYFVHSTGHGLGLEVHEEPRVARGQKHRLEAGNVITIEPGVYVEGVGGIRIEDDIAVRARGNEVLTRIPRDLIEL